MYVILRSTFTIHLLFIFLCIFLHLEPSTFSYSCHQLLAGLDDELTYSRNGRYVWPGLASPLPCPSASMAAACGAMASYSGSRAEWEVKKRMHLLLHASTNRNYIKNFVAPSKNDPNLHACCMPKCDHVSQRLIVPRSLRRCRDWGSLDYFYFLHAITLAP